MAVIEDWNGASIAFRRSRGGVLTFERWEDNVLGSPPWPRSVLSQVAGYVAQRRYFSEADAVALSAHLSGWISKFQSINNEDAVTYSWFGTLAAADVGTRRRAVQWLYDQAGIGATADAPVIDQWVRAFHPNAAGSPRGSGLDARINDPGVALIYVEAKWGADIGTGKGRVENVPDDQVVLRRDSLRRDPNLASHEGVLAVLGVSERKPELVKWREPAGSDRPVPVAWLTWDEVAACPEHPFSDEFARYLMWKRRHGSAAAPKP